MDDDARLLIDSGVLPLFKVVAIAEDGWSDEILERSGGKIWSVYLYDSRRHVHICSLIPSYEMHYLYSYPDRHLEDNAEREQLMDDIDEGMLDSHGVDYMNCSTVCNASSGHVAIVKDYSLESIEELEITYEEALEECLEYADGNHLI
ncbi:hypothetical protein [Chroococcidiopsis sp.]|uniref:hypothetical protein n=1 Tax=Chroococcidiopsis sp. TaxID=3088168 RepID=UPI003F37580D